MMGMTAPQEVDIGTLIESRPDVYGGRPCLAGTRFPVLQIASDFRRGMSASEIVDAYEGLDEAHVHAGIAYYLANKDAVDAELEAERREYNDELRLNAASA